MRNLTAVAAAFAIATAATSLGLVSTVQAATNELTNPTSIIENVTADNITEIAREVGATQIETTEADGTKVVHFLSGTTPFNLGLALCDVRPGTCLGLVMIVGIDPGSKHYPLELFNTFNKNTPFATAIQLDGNKFAVMRMLLTDGGVTKTNIASNLVAFAGAPDAVIKFLAGQLVAGNDKNTVAFAPVGLGNGAVKMFKLNPADIAKIARAQTLAFPKVPALKH